MGLASTEETLTTLVQLAEEVLDIPVHTTRYTRGWFRSTAETWLALPPDIAAALRAYVPFMLTHSARAEGLTMVHRICMGLSPWLTSGQHHVSVTSTNHAHELACAWRATGVQGWTTCQALPILQVYTTVFLHGAGQGHVFMPAFTFPPMRSQRPISCGTACREMSQSIHGGATSRAPSRALVCNWLGKIKFAMR